MTLAGAPGSVDDLVSSVLHEPEGSCASTVTISTGFLTQQGVRHPSRARSYRNHVLSLRAEDVVGSCAVEPGEASEDILFDCVGQSVRQLLLHPSFAVRVATLDAYSQWLRPHYRHGTEVVLGRGSSLRKSMERAGKVVGLLPSGGEQRIPPCGAVRRVLVVGVVNSLLYHLRERGNTYIACDYKGGRTEWGEPVVTDAAAALDECDAVLASGMVVGNGTFTLLLDHARTTGKPLVLFAQTASAVLPWFLGSGVTAVSAEPYPFFWLDGGPSSIYLYQSSAAGQRPPEGN